MSQTKSQARAVSVEDFIAKVEPEQKRRDSERLDALFREVTGFGPEIWNSSILGYGKYHYTYATGREGESLATGFSPRKSALSVYIMPGYADFSDILKRLGKHKIGKSCLYINKLADVDESVLAQLIRAGLRDLATHWPVEPT